MVLSGCVYSAKEAVPSDLKDLEEQLILLKVLTPYVSYMFAL